MTIQIGRIPAINEPNDWKQTGDQIQIHGIGGAGAVDSARIVREQLLGYSNNLDEPIIPIVDTTDDRLTGFYRALAVDVPTKPELYLPSTGIVEWTVMAERVSGYQAVQIESFVSGALMANDFTLSATVEPFHAITQSLYEYTNDVPGYTVDPARPLADGSGNILWFRLNPTAAAPTYKTLARYGLIPADYYKGACEIRSTSLADHVIVGRQGVVDFPDFYMQNGLIKVSSANFRSSTVVDIYGGDATNAYRSHTTVYWAPAAAGGLSGGGKAGGGGVRILRNSPEACIARFPTSPLTDGSFAPSIDIMIRRGSRVVTCIGSSSKTDTWKLFFGSVTASTAITGGVVQTANDGFGNRFGLVSPYASAADTTNGGITATVAKSVWPCAVLFELGGSGSANRNTVASQFLQFLAAQAERMQVVGR